LRSTWILASHKHLSLFPHQNTACIYHLPC
jgi:hypothetical protein